MKTKLLFVSAALVIGFSSSNVRADWKGEVKMTLPEGKGGEGGGVGTGTVYGTLQKMRMNMNAPMNNSVVVDMKAKKSFVLMHTHKAYMEQSLADSNTGMSSCDSGDYDACLKKEGFAKIGSESANGHPCNVYQKTSDGKLIKLWRPTDLKEVPIVRSQASEGGRGESRVDFLNITTNVTIPAGDFEIPSDYLELQMGRHPRKKKN